MDLSSEPSGNEDRIMQRQLYRAGEGNKPLAAKTPASPSAIKAAAPPPRSVAKKSSAAAGGHSTKGQRILLMIVLLGFGYYLLHGTAEQRKKVFKGFGVVAWLLFLCGASYYVFLPDLKGIAEDISKGRQAIFEDKSLTDDQKREKMREIGSKLSNLTPDQRRAVFEINRKEMVRKGNKDIVGFLQLSKAEQYAAMKKRVDDMEKRRAQWGGQAKNKGGQNKGGQNKGGAGGGGPGGGRGGGGPGGGGWGGGGGGGGSPLGGMADSTSPESRAGRQYQGMMMRQMGGFGGGQGGGPRGGAGGAPGGGKGGGR